MKRNTQTSYFLIYNVILNLLSLVFQVIQGPNIRICRNSLFTENSKLDLKNFIHIIIGISKRKKNRDKSCLIQ